MDYVKYNSGNYDKYLSKNILKQKMILRFDRKIINMLKKLTDREKAVSETIRIADIGCGEGFVTNLIAEAFPQAKVTGIDGSQKAIEIARSLNQKIEYKLGNIYDLDYPDRFFDIVVCSEVLEHLEEPQKAVSELCRVAGKAVLLTVPNEPWFCLGNLAALHNVCRLGNPEDHINHWTFFRFKKFVKRSAAKKIAVFDRSFPWSMAIIDLTTEK